MAFASAKQKQITVTAPRVELTLSPEEAAALSVVLSRVGGIPADTARGELDSIRVALAEVGLDWADVRRATEGDAYELRDLFEDGPEAFLSGPGVVFQRKVVVPAAFYDRLP